METQTARLEDRASPAARRPLPWQPPGLARFFLTSLLAGARSLGHGQNRAALARIANPLSYPRYMEYQLAFRQLELDGGCNVLDIGSPKLPALVLAKQFGGRLTITDIRDYFIASTNLFITRLNVPNASRITLAVADARALQFDDATFDRVYSISVIEHIPNEGDSVAMGEIARVLKPGGVLTITVPFAASGLVDEYIKGDVYERKAEGARTFFQRRYDVVALEERLVAPSGLELEEMVFFGEPHVPFERYWNRIPMKAKLPLLWAQPFLAKLFLKELSPDQVEHACGVALKLRKPSH